jgi:hypothetical protein
MMDTPLSSDGLRTYVSRMGVTIKVSISGTKQTHVYEVRTEIASSELGVIIILRSINALNESHAMGLMRKQLSDFAYEFSKAIDRPFPDNSGA